MHNFSKKKQPYYGSLYVVATPIGNINDISKRAIDILSGVDLIASEDTRHSKKLLNSIGIKAKQISYHKHNEAKISDKLIQLLIDGKNIALISDAGTPTLSDPGDNLIRKSIQKGITVSWPICNYDSIICKWAWFRKFPIHRFFTEKTLK